MILPKRKLPFEFDEEVHFVPFNKGDIWAIIDGDVMGFIACPPAADFNVKKKRKSDFEVEDMEVVVDGVTQIIPAAENPEEPAPKKLYADFTDHEKEMYLDISWENFQSKTLKVVEMCSATGFLMAVKSSTNFRDLIFPPQEDGTGYKAQRGKGESSKYRNPFVPKLREMAVEAGIAIEAYDREADDMIRIWSVEATECGDQFVIGSIDKDLTLIAGKHLHLKKEVIYTVTPTLAARFYYEQLLKGDPTDNIPGIPKVGPKKAEALLDPYDTVHEFQAAVIDAYQEVFGKDEWLHQLLANGKLLYLQTHIDDYFNIRGWARFG